MNSRGSSSADITNFMRAAKAHRLPDTPGNASPWLPGNLSERLVASWNRYQTWVKNNESSSTKIENAFQFVSIMISGRFEWSLELAEFLYSASNILGLVNSFILHPARFAKLNLISTIRKLKGVLVTLEYVQVFIEIFSSRILGDPGRWVVIYVIEAIKLGLRSILLYHFKDGLQVSVASELSHVVDDELAHEQPNFAIIGKRSGRLIKTFTRGPLVVLSSPSTKVAESLHPIGSSEPDYWQWWIAESLHIARPLAHLTSLLCIFGQKSLSPWLLSISMDTVSFFLHDLVIRKQLKEQRSRGIERLSIPPELRMELRRRALVLVLYFLRSPFYDRFSEKTLLGILSFCSATIPGSKLALGPLKDFLIYWQKIYFHSWGL